MSGPDYLAVMAYEQGELDLPGVVSLFSALVASGMAWQLQGSYGRMARALIEDGYLSESGAVLRDVAEETGS